tara:strand:+ start:564 stop:1256 length:693 start_codon:yes stop_codon:yes gene_type:complete
MTAQSNITLFSILCLTVILSACSHNFVSHKHYLQSKGLNPEQTTGSFEHCKGYGCKTISAISLSEQEWNAIEKHFSPQPQNAQKERQSIAASIAEFEKIVGQKTGTSNDVWGTFQSLGQGQLDCVDESTNTTIYLMLLEQNNLLKYHTTSAPDTRLPLIHGGRWPHQTATIIETQTQEKYVVDSWFHNNAEPAEIVPLKTWKSGWKPNTSNDTIRPANNEAYANEKQISP